MNRQDQENRVDVSNSENTKNESKPRWNEIWPPNTT